MNTQEKIKHLFEELNIDEQILILEELHKLNNSKSKPSKNVVVESCPYCSSVLWSKNGHQDIKQRYNCKACHKIFTSVSGSCCHGIKKMDKFEEYKNLILTSSLLTLPKRIFLYTTKY